MRLSNYFLPTLKENPIDAKIVSHQLMIRAGMVRQINSGIYCWLPLGLKVLNKIANKICHFLLENNFTFFNESTKKGEIQVDIASES